MITAKLERLYDQLTAAERHAALLAAYDRGDEAEAERLAATARPIFVRMSEVRPHAMAFLTMIAFEQMEFLTLAGWLSRYVAASRESECDADGDGFEFADECATVYAWRLTLEEEAWEVFRTEIGYGGRDPLADLPGHNLRETVAGFAKRIAVSTAELAERLKKPEAEMMTVEQRRQAMHAEFDFWLKT